MESGFCLLFDAQKEGALAA